MMLENKVALITGANQGLGFEVAKHFIEAGAAVMICARDVLMLQKANKSLSNLAKKRELVQSFVCDVSDRNNVDALMEKTISHFGKIDIIVSNAGIYGPKGSLDSIDWDEWSDTIDINLKGSVYVCKAAIPFLKKQPQGKIILLSGGGATKPLPNLSAYAASKAAIVRFGETLAEELKPFHIDVNSIAPGALNTRLLDEILKAGIEKVGASFYEQSLQQQKSGGHSLAIAASLCVYLASNESNGITGKLISAVWDPWKHFSKYAPQLKNSDIYTLRRILPEDRGQQWSPI